MEQGNAPKCGFLKQNKVFSCIIRKFFDLQIPRAKILVLSTGADLLNESDLMKRFDAVQASIRNAEDDMRKLKETEWKELQ